MTIFGWGNSFKDFEVPNTNQIITTTYKYFHIWWLLRITFSRQFILSSHSTNQNGEVTTVSKPITRKEIKTLIGNDLVKPWWFIFNQSLSIMIIGLVMLVGISLAMPRKEEPLTVNKVLNSSVWTKTEQEFMAKNSTDQESAKFETKFKKADKLKEYQLQRALLKDKK
jgi:hypothetical protein